MAEDMMNEEMTGMAAPSMDEPMPTEEPAVEEVPSIDMETLMGNFMDLTDDERKIATRLLATPATTVLDKIMGEPILSRLVEQLGTPIDTGNEESAPAGEGMMAPTEEPMADMPEEEEEATPPV